VNYYFLAQKRAKMQQVNQDLNFLERRELLEKYRSDLRKVDFERNYLTQLIQQLENELQIPSAATTAPQRNIQYAAPKTTTTATKAPKQKRNYSKSSSSEDALEKQRVYGVKLSAWDILMLDTLENITEPLNSGSLLEIFEAKNASLTKSLDDKQLRNALSRTVHKLANKKDIVLKDNFAGKGFLYTLNPNYQA
jgi:S-methylmethionine-dependent homocysteine/selenocysteine methylase